MRAASWLLVVALTTAACSGDDTASDASGSASASTSAPAPTAAPSASVPDAVSATTVTTVPPEPPEVTMSVAADDLALAAQLTATAGGGADPFGDFATCAGQADRIGAYAVGVGDADGSVRWLSVVTADRIDGPGAYDADVRIELGAGGEVVAVGTLTLDPGMVSGSFRASTTAGAALEGDFECSSPGAAVTGPPTDGLVEVVALLRMGDAERVVMATSDDPAVVACPSAADAEPPAEPLIVGVDGEVPATGSISQFALFAGDGGGSGSLDLVAGGTAYEFGRVAITIAADRRSGVYAATGTGGVGVDGAFSCTFG